jgi:hypothetical protein
MAERRMFAKSIVLSDAFLDMPLSARCLYFTLGMMADDDGFVSGPKSIMRQCGASEDDMKMLLAKRYILSFESGVIVIKHWRINNYLRSDRYQQTTYIEEKDTLTLDQKGAYTEINKVGIPSMGIPSIGKDRLGKDSKEKNIKKFVPPTFEEVKAYSEERGNKVDPQFFFDYFTEGKWVDSKGNPVRNWKQKMVSWEKHNPPKPVETNKKIHNFNERNYDYEALKREMGITT